MYVDLILNLYLVLNFEKLFLEYCIIVETSIYVGRKDNKDILQKFPNRIETHAKFKIYEGIIEHVRCFYSKRIKKRFFLLKGNSQDRVKGDLCLYHLYTKHNVVYLSFLKIKKRNVQRKPKNVTFKIYNVCTECRPWKHS